MEEKENATGIKSSVFPLFNASYSHFVYLLLLRSLALPYSSTACRSLPSTKSKPKDYAISFTQTIRSEPGLDLQELLSSDPKNKRAGQSRFENHDLVLLPSC